MKHHKLALYRLRGGGAKTYRHHSHQWCFEPWLLQQTCLQSWQESKWRIGVGTKWWATVYGVDCGKGLFLCRVWKRGNSRCFVSRSRSRCDYWAVNGEYRSSSWRKIPWCTGAQRRSGMLTKILVPTKFNPGSREPRFAGRFDEHATVSIWNCAKKIEFLFLANVEYDFYHRDNSKQSTCKVIFCDHGGMTRHSSTLVPQTSSALFRFFVESDTSCPILRV